MLLYFSYICFLLLPEYMPIFGIFYFSMFPLLHWHFHVWVFCRSEIKFPFVLDLKFTDEDNADVVFKLFIQNMEAKLSCPTNPRHVSIEWLKDGQPFVKRPLGRVSTEADARYWFWRGAIEVNDWIDILWLNDWRSLLCLIILIWWLSALAVYLEDVLCYIFCFPEKFSVLR